MVTKSKAGKPAKGKPALKVKPGGKAPTKPLRPMPPAEVLKEAAAKADRIEKLMLDEEKAKNELKRVRSQIRRLTTDLIAEVRHPEQGRLPLGTEDAPKGDGEPALDAPDAGPAPAGSAAALVDALAKAKTDKGTKGGRGKGHAAGDPDADAGPLD